MTVIYRILNVATDHFYVGSTINHRRRKWEHWDALKKNTHHCSALQAAWNYYGADAFEFEIIETCGDAEAMLVEEDVLLLQHAGQPHCYNTAVSVFQSASVLDATRGKISQTLRDKFASDPLNHPRQGARHTDETRAKISAKVRKAVAEGRGGKFIPSAETRAKMSESLRGNQCAKGHIRSEEHRRKLSEANKGNQNWLGKTHTAEARAKMSKAIVETTTSTEFPSLSAALAHYSMKMPTLRRALVTGEPLAKGAHKGLTFRYKNS